ncbi:hypothetical protein M0804_013899 [Polistes exclamans]|nr:hypothetical protein M0804_013899 [Polistes exclamans]
MTKILAKEIEQTGISEEQQGFRRNRSTVDVTFILRKIAEKSIKLNKPIFICFFDLQQAVDKVMLWDALQLLRARGVNSNTVRLIRLEGPFNVRLI